MCLEASANGKARAALFRAFKNFPGALVRAPRDPHLGVSRFGSSPEMRAVVCGTRVTMRNCQYCLVPAGITPSSRRFYEALAAGCIPVLLSDRFVLPFTAASSATRPGGGHGAPRSRGRSGSGGGSDLLEHRHQVVRRTRGGGALRGVE